MSSLDPLYRRLTAAMAAGRLLLVIMTLAGSLSGCRVPEPGEHIPRIGFMQLLEDPQLDEGRRGFVKALEDAGLASGRDFVLKYRSAQGDQSLLPMIVQGFLSEGVRIIATSTSPCMIAAARGTMALPDPPTVVITIPSEKSIESVRFEREIASGFALAMTLVICLVV
jgi:ABC-type uncharacterized transport system substrate-binding protein